MAPCAASARAMPQAIEWSLATPMTSPRLPCINAVMGPHSHATRASARRSRVEPLEHQGGVGAAEPERIGQDAADLHVVAALAHDRHVGERWIEILDVGAL